MASSSKKHNHAEKAPALRPSKPHAGPVPRWVQMARGHNEKQRNKQAGPVSAPVKTQRISVPVAAGQVITRQAATNSANYTFKGTDYLGTLDIPNAGSNTNGVVLDWTPLNPMTMNNARLRTFARMYQDYRVKKFTVWGTQCQGTNIGGVMAAFFDTDVARISSAQGDQMMAYAMTHQKASMRPCWGDFGKMNCPTDGKWRKCNPGQGDPRESIFAVLCFVLGAPPTATTFPFALYELMMDYEIEFRNPMIQDVNISDTTVEATLLPVGATGNPYVSPIAQIAPAMPYNVAVAIVIDPGSSDLTPGGVYFAARDQNNLGGVALFTDFDAAYTNQAVGDNSLATTITWDNESLAAAKVQLSPISAPFLDLNADGAGLTGSISGGSKKTELSETGTQVELSSFGNSATFEDINAKLPNALRNGTIGVEATLGGLMAAQGYQTSMTTTSAESNPDIAERLEIEPITALMLSKWNDPVAKVILSTVDTKQMTAPLPGFWQIFDRLGGICSAVSESGGFIRTIIRAVRQRRMDLRSTAWYSDAKNLAYAALTPHERWLAHPSRAMFRAAETQGLLEWRDQRLTYKNHEVIYKRAYVNGWVQAPVPPPDDEDAHGFRNDFVSVKSSKDLQPDVQPVPDQPGSSKSGRIDLVKREYPFGDYFKTVVTTTRK